MKGFADVHRLPQLTRQVRRGTNSALAGDAHRHEGRRHRRAGGTANFADLAIAPRSKPVAMRSTIPSPAHRINPASAALQATLVEISATAEGRVNLDAPKRSWGRRGRGDDHQSQHCGLFEREMKAISEAVHAAGGLVYCDSANFNAIVGRSAPAALASMPCTSPTGPSAPAAAAVPGPVVLSRRCAHRALPLSRSRRRISSDRGRDGGEHHAASFGQMTAFSQPDGRNRALATSCRTELMVAPGCRGCRPQRQLYPALADDVLDARRRYRALHARSAFSDAGLAEGFTTLDIAKALIDEAIIR